MTVTFYNNTSGKEKVDAELISIVRAIRKGNWKDKVIEYRNIVSEKGKESDEAKLFKRYDLPAFTVSGTFENARKASQLTAHSGFIAVDIDGVEDVESTCSELYADDYTYAGFVSVSGSGICLIVKIDPKKHLESFLGLEHYYFKKYNLQIDQACKDVNRLRFVSDDPDLIINESAKIFKDYPPKQKGRPKKQNHIVTGKNDFEYVLQQIQERHIDLTSDYGAWVEIGMAIKSEFGDMGLEYYHAISQYYNGYDPDKTARKYKSFSATGKTTIASFFYYAKQAGLEIKTPETKVISTVAKFAKKGRRTAKDAVRQLEKIDGIDPGISEPIVKQIYSSPDAANDDSEDDLVFQIQEFIKRQYDIRYNEVTNKYELSGVPMSDRDTNSIYLDCKGVIPKASKDLIISCIDSDRTPQYNPIKEFFRKNAHLKPNGLIREISDTLDTPTGKTGDKQYHDYAYYFIRKWMIGAVAMWLGKHSPLMLVLAGERQNTGKTHWFRYILPDEMQSYFGEAELTGDKDENLMMCSKMILSNDEMSNKSKRDIAMVKKLCSAQWFNLRRPYGRLAEDFRRIAALAGTSNPLEIISDPTGNRRIIPIEVLDIDHEKYNAIDKTELWLEAYHAFKDGEEYQLSRADIDNLNSQTAVFEEASAESDLIMKYCMPPNKGSLELVTATEIKDYIEKRSEQRLNIRKLGMELKKLGYEKNGQRIDGVMKQVYSISFTDGTRRNVNKTVPDDIMEWDEI